MSELKSANHHCNLMRLFDLMQYSLPKYLSQLGICQPSPHDKFSLLDGQMDKMINPNPAHTSLLITVSNFY